MPRKPRVPSYRLHRASGQAVVTICGRDFYLGVFDTEESHQEYKRLIAEYLASGGAEPLPKGGADELTVAELCARYFCYAQNYYPAPAPGQSQSGQIDRVRRAIKLVGELYGTHLARDFGPRALKAVRDVWVREGHTRSYINSLVGCVKRCWKWGLADQLVPAACYQSLLAVEGLKEGRSEAPEGEPVTPVEQWVLDHTLPGLNPVMRDVVAFQVLTGARPGEALHLRVDELDRSGEVWMARPKAHKTAWRGDERLLWIGPRAQQLLGPYLQPGRLYPFKPHRPPSNGEGRPYYLVSSYGQAILKSCDRADARLRGALTPEELAVVGERAVPRWHPHQLRHNAATSLVAEFGWDVARIVLGHSTLDATRIYGEDDKAKAREAMRKVG